MNLQLIKRAIDQVNNEITDQPEKTVSDKLDYQELKYAFHNK